MTKARTFLIVAVLVAASIAGRTAAGAQSPSVFDMDLEQLMNLEVSVGSLTSSTRARSPAAITVIDRHMIAVAPARNLADLIEIYVPGSTFTGHINHRIGIRGIMIDRNYKLLLLVNGRNLNNKSQIGADLEIANWDLNDIERVEVIRGPGSVTHGPGAIAGVINIITRRADQGRETELGAVYVGEYDSRGGYASSDWVHDDYSVHAYASYRDTKGLRNHKIFGVDGGTGAHGYYGDDYLPGKTPANHYGDIFDPQVKAHVDITFLEDWRLWVRFTQSETPHHLGKPTIENYAGENLAGGISQRKAVAVVLENDHAISEDSRVVSTLSYDAEHFLMSVHRDDALHYNEGILNYPPDAGCVNYNSAEQELFLSSVLHTHLADRHNVALGASVAYEWVKPSDWISTRFAQDYVAMNAQGRKAPDGTFIQDRLGDGFSVTTFSLMGEADWYLHPRLNLLLAGRMDKNKWSKTLFSPRAGLISEINPRHVVKAFWQRSVRMNTLFELFVEDMYGEDSSPEELDDIELTYSALPHPNLGIDLTLYHNQLDALGWNGTRTVSLGDLEFIGVEAELRWRTGNVVAGINHSTIELIDWETAEGVNSQGISYSDYDVDVGAANLASHGDHLMNMPHHMSKLFFTVEELPWRVFAHVDAAIIWDYEGRDDVIRIYEDAYADAGGDAAFNELSKRLDAEGFGDPEIKLNCALGKRFTRNGVEGTITLKAFNLLRFKRYGYDAGNSRAYPHRISWVEEPVAFAIETAVKF